MTFVPRLGSGIPLVARTAQLRELRAALRRAQQGSAGALLVSGDAGVGKTRLLTEFAAAADRDGALVLTGRCLDISEAGLPYLPFAEAFGRLAASEAELFRQWPAISRLLPRQELDRELALAADPAPRYEPDAPVAAGMRRDMLGGQAHDAQDIGQLQLFDAVVGLLESLAAERTVLLVLEDLHWADSSTRNLLAMLFSRLRAQSLLVVASYRAEELHRRHPLRPLLGELIRLPMVDRIELPPFDPAETREFVLALADGPLDEAVLCQVVERSEGNAFFAEELLGWDGAGSAGLQASLADALLARIERLSQPTQSILRVAAVAGGSVSHAQLAVVAGGVERELDADRELDTALREAVQHHVLVTDHGHYTFRHSLLREAVYQDLLPGERVRLHASYAARLAECAPEPGHAAQLAYHRLASNDLAGALHACVAAAKEAERAGAPTEELRHLEKALSLWDAVEPERRGELDQLSLLRGAAGVALIAGEPERGLAFAESAVAMLTGTEEPERAALVWRRLTLALGAFDGKEDREWTASQRAWELVKDRPLTEVRVWVLGDRAALLRVLNRLDEARVAAEQVIKDAAELGLAAAEADALITLAVLNERSGDIEQTVTSLLAAVQRAERLDAPSVELRARTFLAVTYYEHGQLPEALATIAESRERARAFGLARGMYVVDLRVLQVLARYAAGEWDRLTVPEVDRVWVSNAVSARLSAAYAPLLAGLGRFEQLGALSPQLRQYWGSDTQAMLLSSYAEAEAALWQGDLEAAIERAEQGLSHLETLAQPEFGGVRLATFGVRASIELARAAADDTARAAALARGHDLARHARRQAEVYRPRSGSLGSEGKAWLSQLAAEQASLSGADPAAWELAVRGFGYGAVYQQAVCRLRYAEALLATGANDVAAEELAKAWHAAQRLAATPLRAAVHLLARRAGVPLPGEPTTSAAEDDVLTPRERAVLELVARGHTNRAVGAELFISEKTVSVHLSRAMAKLGASRRAEAVAIAAERGLLGGGAG
ncbi:helix-turn-helix transcriptional regulator [Tamaricihabitans halophyticus]|nr:helix-turn-helix transcriptional regulator [Tamaricihabitans halophyticus]